MSCPLGNQFPEVAFFHIMSTSGDRALELPTKISIVDCFSPWLWGAVLIIIGIPLCLLGRKLFNVTLFLIGTLLTTTLILLIFYGTFLSDNTEAWVGWTVLTCSILLGIAGGYLLYKC